MLQQKLYCSRMCPIMDYGTLLNVFHPLILYFCCSRVGKLGTFSQMLFLLNSALSILFLLNAMLVLTMCHNIG